MSKICSKCGAENMDNINFCRSCGANFHEQIGNIEIAGYEQNYAPNNNLNSNVPNNYESEKTAYSLAAGGFVGYNSLNEILENDAIITNKRLYFNITKGVFNKYTSHEIVDLEDITGTKIIMFSPLLIIIFGVLSAIIEFLAVGSESENQFSALIIGAFIIIVAIVTYLAARRRSVRIEYAGGRIDIDASDLNESQVKNFQNQIMINKERCIRRNSRN